MQRWERHPMQQQEPQSFTSLMMKKAHKMPQVKDKTVKGDNKYYLR